MRSSPAAACCSGFERSTRSEQHSTSTGKYDPRHHAFDGTTLTILHKGSKSLPVVIPPIYGLKNVGFETYTGDGPISYWNSYVGVSQMGGQGNFSDDRIDLFIEQSPDLVTPKLAALFDYQVGLHTPKPPEGSFNRQAANRGRQLFQSHARCASCHSDPTTYTDVLSSPEATVPVLHEPTEIGTEPVYATRSATGKYRTTPLRALWQHAPYFHDGSAADLPAVVEHYNTQFKLNLTAAQKGDLVEFLKSL
jgi:hypothetical protein